jgi:hypothetical protein
MNYSKLLSALSRLDPPFPVLKIAAKEVETPVPLSLLSLTSGFQHRAHDEAILVREPINKIHSACASELTSRSPEPKAPPKRPILFLMAAFCRLATSPNHSEQMG